MEPFDYNEIPEENPQPQAPAPEAEPYIGAGAGRKESPYANSPYIAYEQPQYQYEQPKPQKEKKSRKSGRGKRVLAVILVVALMAAGCGITAFAVNSQWEQKNQKAMADLNSRIAALENGKVSVPGSNGIPRPVDGSAMTPAQLYEACVDSVVAISTTVRSQSFYGTTEGTSSGSGFVLSADGYVVTNFHVVDGASKVEVILHNGEEYEAAIVGSDSTNDLAVLKVEAENLSAATLGSSDDMNIGDMVAAIGNPLGELAATQTVGYVSGVGREVTTDNTIIEMIQTDCAINPGNSGGPLFNMYGEVIGITTAKYSGTTGSGATIEGIGFAIPIGDVMKSISDLVDYGYVTGAFLAVTVQNMDAESASYYNLPMGAYIVTVEKDGAADRAGIQPKDIIINLGGHEVKSVTDLTRALRKFKAGDTTTVTIVRGGVEKQLTITLDEKPQDLDKGSPAGEGSMPSDGSYEEWYDFFFGPNGG